MGPRGMPQAAGPGKQEGAGHTITFASGGDRCGGGKKKGVVRQFRGILPEASFPIPRHGPAREQKRRALARTAGWQKAQPQMPSPVKQGFDGNRGGIYAKERARHRGGAAAVVWGTRCERVLEGDGRGAFQHPEHPNPSQQNVSITHMKRLTPPHPPTRESGESLQGLQCIQLKVTVRGTMFHVKTSK